MGGAYRDGKKVIREDALTPAPIAVAPEFAGAVISRPGSLNAVQFSAEHDASQVTNYYRGESAQATLQASSIIAMIQIPAGFAGWAPDAIKYLNKVDGTPGSTGLTVKVYDTGGTLRHTDTKQANAAWTETVIADTDLAAGTFTPGAMMKIEFLMEAQAVGGTPKGVQLGKLTLTPKGN